MLNFFKTRSHTEAFSSKEKHASFYIPYKTHWNKNTILTKNNELLQIVKLSGFSFQTADESDIQLKREMRNLLFKNLTAGELSLHLHIIRKRKPLNFYGADHTFDPTVKVPNDFISYLNNEWHKKYESFDSFFNELYISISYKRVGGGIGFVENIQRKLSKAQDADWKDDLKEMCENLNEATSRILNSFRDYDARLLQVVETNSGTYCEILEFLGSIVNCGRSTRVLVPKNDIDNYLPATRLFFGSKAIEARSPHGSKFAGLVSIFEYGPTTYAGMLDRFLQLPFEFIITQTFSFVDRGMAISNMQLQQNRMIQAGDKAVSQIAEISQAIDMAMSGDIGFGEHHLTIMCIEDTQKALENTLSLAAVELSNCGLQSVREKINMEACYWSQLPCNSEYIVRKCIINTLNLADFAPMHNFPLGKIKGNHWGEYLTILETTSGTPFFFNFHVRDVGHTLIIGPTGAGKTVLMNFLCAQAQKFKCRMYFFDKDRGAEIFIRALGGVYNVVDPGKLGSLNPLQLDDTGENRTFLLEWLKALAMATGERVSAEDTKLLTQAIAGNYKLHPRDRKLANIAPFFGMDGPGTLASRLSMWHGKGSHAKVFDNDIDKIDLSVARIFGFEMAELLKDKFSMAPALLYIFHRINLSLDGSPTMIVLDEAWALIDNEVFAPKIKDWLKVLRKLNTFVVFATQSVEDAAKSSISDTLIQQTATQIFLPNLKATSVYKSAFMLTNREYDIVKSIEPSSRYFLVKQGISSVVARANLSGMANIVNVLSGRTETVLLLHGILEEVGYHPETWLPIFYKEALKV